MPPIDSSLNWRNPIGSLAAKILLITAALASVTGASAHEFELSQLARELSIASNTLSRESKYSRGFGSVGQRADRLARDSTQLVDAIARRRSASYIRSQYADVSERYSELEDAFFRASRNYSDAHVFNQVGLISGLFSDLSSVYYYSPIYSARTQVVTFVNPVIVQRQTSRPYGFRGNNGTAGAHYERGSQQLERRNSDQRTGADRPDVVERLREVRGQHRTGQRVIRQRSNNTRNPRRRN
jgi:hypothetical protein